MWEHLKQVIWSSESNQKLKLLYDSLCLLTGLFWRQLHIAAPVPWLHLTQPLLPEHSEASDASRGQTTEWLDVREETKRHLKWLLIKFCCSSAPGLGRLSCAASCRQQLYSDGDSLYCESFSNTHRSIFAILDDLKKTKLRPCPHGAGYLTKWRYFYTIWPVMPWERRFMTLKTIVFKNSPKWRFANPPCRRW